MLVLKSDNEQIMYGVVTVLLSAGIEYIGNTEAAPVALISTHKVKGGVLGVDADDKTADNTIKDARVYTTADEAAQFVEDVIVNNYPNLSYEVRRALLNAATSEADSLLTLAKQSYTASNPTERQQKSTVSKKQRIAGNVSKNK